MTTDNAGQRTYHWRQIEDVTRPVAGGSTPTKPIEGEVTDEDREIAAQIKARVRARLDAAARKES